MSAKKAHENRDRPRQGGQPFGGQRPQAAPQRPAHRGHRPAPDRAAGPREQDHIQPEPALHRLHAAHEQRRHGGQAEQGVRQRGGQARPVPQPAQYIVQQAEPRPHQEKPSGLTELLPDPYPHYRNSLDQKPVPGPLSS